MLSWIIKFCCSMILVGCILTACIFVTGRDQAGIIPIYNEIMLPETDTGKKSMHFVYGDLFTIIDDDKKEWFYGE